MTKQGITRKVGGSDEAIQADINKMQGSGWSVSSMVPTAWDTEDNVSYVVAFWITYEKEVSGWARDIYRR